MSTKRLVPLLTDYDKTVRFTDGPVILPDWQQALLPRGTRYVDTTYEIWKTGVANESFVGNAVRSGIGNLLERHFQQT